MIIAVLGMSSGDIPSLSRSWRKQWCLPGGLRNPGYVGPDIGPEWSRHSGVDNLHTPGRHPPEAFQTMCSGEDHGLVERRIILISSILLNSSFAEFSLSGGNRRARTLIAGPVVLMRCSTLCLVGNVANWGVVICPNFESNL